MGRVVPSLGTERVHRAGDNRKWEGWPSHRGQSDGGQGPGVARRADCKWAPGKACLGERVRCLACGVGHVTSYVHPNASSSTLKWMNFIATRHAAMKFIETNPERCNLQSRILNSLCRSRQRPLDQSGSPQDAGGTQSGPSPYNLEQGLLLKRQARRRVTTGTVRLHRECGLLELLLPPA